jgi:predicted DNA-binding protein (MmcQ/YjbR family)
LQYDGAMAEPSTAAAARRALLARALAYPGAWEDHPWGDTAVKIGKKMFLVMNSGGDLSLSLKLPETGEAALTTFAFATPTAYGLGKSGWVSASFAEGEKIPLPLLLEWLDESFHAIAPKRAAKTTASAKKTAVPAKKPAAKKAAKARRK